MSQVEYLNPSTTTPVALASSSAMSNPVIEDDQQALAPELPDESAFDSDSSAFIISLVIHMALLVAFGVTPLFVNNKSSALTITPPIPESTEVTQLPDEFYSSDIPATEVGANSVGDVGMALSLAADVGTVSELPVPVSVTPGEVGKIDLNVNTEVAKGLHFGNLPVKGVGGEGTTGAAGAIDRLTHELLLSLEERKTLVVWLFDQSPSMLPTRDSILKRLDRIYDELGVIEASGNESFKKHSDKPLLTAVIAFGDKVKFVTEKPTDNLAEIKELVRTIPEDNLGYERIFSAIYMAADKYKNYRTENGGRNVMIVAFTDEAGDDTDGLDKTVKMCRRYQMPVFIVGSPAPFGQSETLVKFVDPDPKYDQTPQWGTVTQGPESLFSERLKISFLNDEEKTPIDSGFGPYALSRLCVETGGIYFAVHPNRAVGRSVAKNEIADYAAHLKYFFDPDVMRKYRPDYVPMDEYVRRVSQNKARASLVEAARRSVGERMASPRLTFVKTSEPQLATDMSEAQKGAAKLEPVINMLYETLKIGETDREKEVSPRWQAGYDLAMGQVMAIKVRTDTYNAMLASTKRGLKFKDEKNNTWVLEPSSDVSVGSGPQKMAEKAKMYLERVVSEHPDTPWAMLAKQELKEPMSWKWGEKFTDLNPPRPAPRPAANTPPPPARDEKKMSAPKPLPKREFKRL